MPIYDAIKNFNEQFAYEPIVENGAKFGRFEKFVIAGMGGSGHAADLIKALDPALRITVHRDYGLPAISEKELEQSLIIASSYSGNTEETLTAYGEARRRKAKIMVITSGGKLGDWAVKDKTPCIKIPGGFSPRAALGYSFFPVLKVFARLGLIKDRDAQVKETVNLLARMRDRSLNPDIPAGRNPAKKIALKLKGRYAIIYGAQDLLDSAVTRWRCQLAENAKALASSHLLPEMNHNEIVGWEFPKEALKKDVAIFLRDKGEHPRVKRRIEITRDIIRKEAKEVIDIRSEGGSLLARLFSLIYFADYVSLYLAALNRVDPTPVERITYLKNKLSKG